MLWNKHNRKSSFSTVAAIVHFVYFSFPDRSKVNVILIPPLFGLLWQIIQRNLIIHWLILFNYLLFVAPTWTIFVYASNNSVHIAGTRSKIIQIAALCKLSLRGQRSRVGKMARWIQKSLNRQTMAVMETHWSNNWGVLAFFLPICWQAKRYKNIYGFSEAHSYTRDIGFGKKYQNDLEFLTWKRRYIIV